MYNVENLNNARNELTIYVSDGQGNEALYPLWLNKVSSNTAVKTVIAQRGTSEESVAENNTDTSSNCDSHEVEIQTVHKQLSCILRLKTQQQL